MLQISPKQRVPVSHVDIKITHKNSHQGLKTTKNQLAHLHQNITKHKLQPEETPISAG